MKNETTNAITDLSFLPALQLEANLASALSSMGQSLNHQKLQEFAARVQGYPTLNHRTEPKLACKSVSLLVSRVNNESQVEMASLDVTYLLATFVWEDIQKMKAAVALAKLIDRWACVAISGTQSVAGYKEPDMGLSLDNLDHVVTTLEDEDAELYVRTEGMQVNVEADTGNMWLTGAERYGLSFSSNNISISTLEQAFITGKMESYDGWHLLPSAE